jgi:hypothetical protein
MQSTNKFLTNSIINIFLIRLYYAINNNSRQTDFTVKLSILTIINIIIKRDHTFQLLLYIFICSTFRNEVNTVHQQLEWRGHKL